MVIHGHTYYPSQAENEYYAPVEGANEMDARRMAAATPGGGKAYPT